MRLKDKVALITAATTAQGREQARLFADEGARVILLDPDDEARGALLAELAATGGEADALPLDPDDVAQWESAVKTVRDRFGGVDILVHNARSDATHRIPEIAAEEWESSLGGATGAFLGIRSVLESMMQRGAGSIVLVTSVAALAPPRGISEAHAAMAGALRILAKDVSSDYAADGVRCNAVLAGLVDSGLLGAEKDSDSGLAEQVRLVTPMRRAGTHSEVAQAVLFLASDEASFITGTELVVDGGYVAF